MMDLDTLIAKHLLWDYAEAIRSLARPSVALRRELVEQADLRPTDSRLGGLPHLPAGTLWPRWRDEPLAHLATIRLSEASLHDANQLLPKRGLLYFWYALNDGPWGFDPRDAGFCRVDFIPNEDEPLTLARMPVEEFAEPPYPESGVYAPCRLKFSPGVTLANWEWIREFRPELSELADAKTVAGAKYDKLAEAIQSSGPQHWLLGHAANVQGTMEQECQSVTHGLYFGDATASFDPEFAALAPGASAWRCLLQLDTDEDGPGWMWGDCGRVYFWMPGEAIQQAQFNKAWMILQCS